MSPQHRSFLSNLMRQAWSIFRSRHVPGSDIRTFGDAMRNAWAWLKRAAQAAVPAGPVLQLRTMVQSPIRRSLTGQTYAGTRAARAGYLTSRLGA